LYVNPVIVAEPTVIVHVALDTTSPGAALASLGVVGDGDGRPDGDRPPADGVPVRPAPGVGTTGAAVPVARGADADGEGAAVGAVAGALGLGLGAAGKQKMIRMQV
jgi:hypothetical protein